LFFLEKRTAKRLKKITPKVFFSKKNSKKIKKNNCKNQTGWGVRGNLGFPTPTNIK